MNRFREAAEGGAGAVGTASRKARRAAPSSRRRRPIDPASARKGRGADARQLRPVPRSSPGFHRPSGSQEPARQPVNSPEGEAKGEPHREGAGPGGEGLPEGNA